MHIKHHPSKRYLRQCFRYKNGKLYWRERPLSHFHSTRIHRAANTKRVGSLAGSLMPSGRWSIQLDGTKYYRSRLVWIFHHGVLGKFIDHRSRNKSDDRIENLRLSTTSQNRANTNLCSANTSGTKGVYWKVANKKWCSQIKVDGNNKHLGLFDSKSEASEVYRRAAKSHFGEYAHIP